MNNISITDSGCLPLDLFSFLHNFERKIRNSEGTERACRACRDPGMKYLIESLSLTFFSDFISHIFLGSKSNISDTYVNNNYQAQCI